MQTPVTIYKERLEADLQKITADLSTVARHNSDTDDWEAIPEPSGAGEADINVEADSVESWNERRATVAALETEYRDITRALQKINAGTYGICEISGETIEAERLAIKPTARTCVAHKDQEGTLTL